MSPKALLNKIIGAVTPDKSIWPTPEHERAFKRCLSLVGVKARIEWGDTFQVLHIRPNSVCDFKKKVNEHALANCEVAQITLKELEADPAFFIRFRTER